LFTFVPEKICQVWNKTGIIRGRKKRFFIVRQGEGWPKESNNLFTIIQDAGLLEMARFNENQFSELTN
jgi:hypothetical protein